MRYKHLLIETTIINHKELQNYLEFYANDLSLPQARQFLTKTIKKQIAKGEIPEAIIRIRQDVDISPEYPDWIHTAHKHNDLYGFQVTRTFEEKLEHIIHWLRAVSEDAFEAEDNNVRARAQKILKSLHKMKFADAVKASNEYFKIGKRQLSKKSGLEGREVVFETDDFIWVKLITQQAYEDEGKFLQNCIGRYYKAGDEKNIIYVMKDKKTYNSHVGLRITYDVIDERWSQTERNRNIYKIAEIRGKNNCEPSESYQPATLKFIKFLIKEFKKAGITLEINRHILKSIGIVGMVNGKMYTNLDRYVNDFVDSLNGTIKEGLTEILTSEYARSKLTPESRSKVFDLIYKHGVVLEKDEEMFFRDRYTKKFYRISYIPLFIELLKSNFFSAEDTEKFIDYVFEIFKKIKNIWKKNPNIEVHRLLKFVNELMDHFPEIYHYYINELAPYVRKQKEKLEKEGYEINKLPPEKKEDALRKHTKKVEQFFRNNFT